MARLTDLDVERVRLLREALEGESELRTGLSHIVAAQQRDKRELLHRLQPLQEEAGAIRDELLALRTRFAASSRDAFRTVAEGLLSLHAASQHVIARAQRGEEASRGRAGLAEHTLNEGSKALQRQAGRLRGSVAGLKRALAETRGDAVAGFEGLRTSLARASDLLARALEAQTLERSDTAARVGAAACKGRALASDLSGRAAQLKDLVVTEGEEIRANVAEISACIDKIRRQQQREVELAVEEERSQARGVQGRLVEEKRLREQAEIAAETYKGRCSQLHDELFKLSAANSMDAVEHAGEADASRDEPAENQESQPDGEQAERQARVGEGDDLASDLEEVALDASNPDASMIGIPVSKEFLPGPTMFVGLVVGEADNGLFQIEYEDDDEETMTLGELQEYMWPSSLRQDKSLIGAGMVVAIWNKEEPGSAFRFDIGVVLSRLGKNEGVGGAATLRVEMYQRVSQKASCVYVPSQRGDRRVLDMVVEGGDILAYFPAGMLESDDPAADLHSTAAFRLPKDAEEDFVLIGAMKKKKVQKRRRIT